MRAYLFAVGMCVVGCGVDDIGSVEQGLLGQRVLLPVAGTGQHKHVTKQFHPIDVALYELDGTPVVGATITFTAPASGASAVFEAGGVTETDGEGQAGMTPFANERAGAYTVWAHADGADAVPFLLANHAGAAAELSVTGGSHQAAAFGLPFATPLMVTVTDAHGNGVPGVDVRFAPPSEGPTAAIVDRATTDAAGRATANASAGYQTGSYLVEAIIEGVGEEAFVLRNYDPADHRWKLNAGARAATLHTFEQVGTLTP